MNTLLLIASTVTLVLSDAPVTNDWENLDVNSRNRMPPRAYSMPLANEAAALTDALEPETPYKRSLNGTWKLSWAGNPSLRVKDFWRRDFDDSAWFDIPVPACVEMHGFGSPGYTNQRYPHKLAWPKILDRQSGKPDYNPVSSYRRLFEIPADWAGREVYLRFDGVYSAYYVWVNGKAVGYAEDSKLPSEFKITQYLQPGQNVLAVEVYRWCDGSYLEDQDMTRFSGIFRDVTLWSCPKDGIWDYSVRATADGNLDVTCPGATWKLYDADFKEVAVPVKDVHLWSAETPYLYTLVFKKGSDIRRQRIGFKDQRIDGNVFKVNGKPIKFKGVNRHETNPDTGRSVTLEDMVADITLMKQYNIDTVRTCHYPDHHLWYDLCDKYGIYLVAEANVEGHEPQYGEEGLGRQAAFNDSIVERNARHVIDYRNHPSVTMWSLGNETGHGLCFSNAAARVRALDPTRPVHWERGNDVADVDSAMYPSVEWCERRGQYGEMPDADPVVMRKELSELYGGRGEDHTPGKCFFMCEYAHAMGNAVGDFEDYWDVFYRHPSMCGGCIWDWVDQAIWKYTDRVDPKTGKRDRFLAFGGDFDEQPNDGPFNCNGLVDPFRHVSPKLVEVAHVHRNLVVTRSHVAADNPYAVVFELSNRFAFTRADAFVGSWEVLADGVSVASGAFDVPAVAPLSRCRFTVPGLAEALVAAKPDAELFVNFSFAQKTDTLWAKKGWVVARDQIAMSPAKAMQAPVLASGAVQVTEDDKTVRVVAGKTKAVFCRKSGTLCLLEKSGVPVIKDPVPGVVAGPQFTCARAFIDNDRWPRTSYFQMGLSQLRYHARPIRVSGNVVTTEVEITGSKSGGFTHRATWTFAADGQISVDNDVTPHGTMPTAESGLTRVGLSLRLMPGFEKMTYYGRGPWENYIDRKSASFLGVWRSTVTEQFIPYIHPQDTGGKCDVRWLTLSNGRGTEVCFSASEPLFIQALHYMPEDLVFARQSRGDSVRFRVPLVPRAETCLNLDIRQRGLGGNSCGPNPQKKNLITTEPWHWTLYIR